MAKELNMSEMACIGVMWKGRRNMKLTEYQNQKITDALCEIACELTVFNADELTEIRRALVTECEAINLASKPSSLSMQHETR